ncbi:MAG: hypothetical protein ABI183_10410 [Polyangiaceae bacterium]
MSIALLISAASSAFVACGGTTGSDLLDDASDAGGADAKAHDASARDASSHDAASHDSGGCNGTCIAQKCGDTLTCTATQYCLVEPPGIAFEDGGTPPTSYACVDIPAACSSSPTCDCIEAPAPCDVASCSTSSGGITLNCLGE